MTGNERFSLILILIGCVFSLPLLFLPENKAVLYAPLPGTLISGSLAYLGTKNNNDNITN